MIKKNKIGFVHLPRTAGTYMEGVMASVMGPERFINFFGTPDNQVANKLGIIERIAVDKQRQDCILQIPNWSTAELFSGHFSLNVEPFLPQEYNYSYITIIRDPITRVYSFVKKVTSSGGFRRHLTSNGDDPIGGDIFWERFIDYCNNNDIDLTSVNPMVNKSLKEKIKSEAINLKMIKEKKGGTLPV